MVYGQSKTETLAAGLIEEYASKLKMVVSTKRMFTRAYYFPHSEAQKVGQHFFRTTLGYSSNAFINTIVKAKKDQAGSPRLMIKDDARGKQIRQYKVDRAVINEHIKSFNPHTSH